MDPAVNTIQYISKSGAEPRLIPCEHDLTVGITGQLYQVQKSDDEGLV